MKRKTPFKKLLEPTRIGQLSLRNRIVMPGMGLNFATHEGYVTEREKAFYGERAAGGAGTIILGIGCIDPAGKLIPNQLCIYDDSFVPGLSELAETIRHHGTRAFIQLQHGGGLCRRERIGGLQPVAPSPITKPGVLPGREQPRELTLGEIKDIVNRFADGAQRAVAAGFDGVEIHAGHGYLIAQFLSGYSNKRGDSYGGNLNNRARFLIEIIEAIRSRVGEDFPIWCRIDGREFGLRDGITIEDAQDLAQMIERAGIDAIDVSGYGGSTDYHFTEAPLSYAPGNLVPLAESIRKVVNIPIIAVGRISPELGERVLHNGKADLIAMARPLIADPQLPLKIASGRMDDVRPCINCYTCVYHISMGESIRCAVNALAGREHEQKPLITSKPRKVMVVGGGPAGMEVARIAALRGHQATLYERENRLGGSLFFASILNKENEPLLRYMIKQTRKLPIQVKTGIEITPQSIPSFRPDAVIIATGPKLSSTQINSVDGNHTISGTELRHLMGGRDITGKLRWWQRLVLRISHPLLRRFMTPAHVRQLTRLWMPLGKTVTIIGTDFVSCELADFLAQRGRKVVVLGNNQELATEVPLPKQWILIHSLRENGIKVLTGVECERLTKEGVVVNHGETTELIKADTVIITESIEPNLDLVKAIDNKASVTLCAGDCNGLGLIAGAIAEGTDIALNI